MKLLRSMLLVALLGVSGLRAVSNITDCIANLGAAAPMPTCTVANPCLNPLFLYGTNQLSTPQSQPEYCAWTFEGRLYNDGKPTAIDVPGQPTDAGTPTTRYYCKYVPPTASASNRVPLIAFFDGSGGTATAPYRYGIRPWAASGIAGVFGGSPFALVGLQSLNRHWPASGAIGGEDGAKYDFYFRNMSQNDDVRYTDAVVDTLVATGVIDRTRIYVMGYSNGAHFSMFYGAVRSGSTNAGQWAVNMTGMTPGGNVIAAAAPFSGADPFHSNDCWYNPEGRSRLPVQITIYLCDLILCGDALAYISTLQNTWQSINATIIPLNDDGSVGDVNQCTVRGPVLCTYAKRTANHLKYPTWRVTQMIAFLGSFTSADVLPSTTTTAAPQTTTTTVVNSNATTDTPSLKPSPTPSSTRASHLHLFNGTIRIAGTQFNTLLSNATMCDALSAYVATDIARLLNIPVSSVIITGLALGSLVVNYTVTTDALSSTTTAATVQQAATQASSSATWLVNTSALYAQVAPTETLTVTTSTATSAAANPTPAPPLLGATTSAPATTFSTSTCSASCIGFYAAIGAAAVLVVGA